MSNERFRIAVLAISEICNRINSKDKESLEYVVLQDLPKDDPYLRDPFIMYKIAEFYNQNWVGNVDFMHIPSFEQVEYNCKTYPTIIAREKDTKEIVGISTLKYEENSKYVEDPYYPILHEKYFSITGILTKMDNPHRGVGKKIYEICLKGHYAFNKVFNDTSIMCVIDCRNKNSLNALNSAAERLNDSVEENMVAKISGYYVLTDDCGKMIEAPTVVLKVEEDKKRDEQRSVMEFNDDGNDLFKSLLTTLEDEFTDVSEPVINMDEGTGLVSYYHVRNYHSLPKVISNGTEKGNNRKVEENTNVKALCKVRTIRR